MRTTLTLALLVLAAPALADEKLTFDRLELTLPTGFTAPEAAADAKTRDIVPTAHKASAVVRLFGAIHAKGTSLQERLANVAVAINKDRTVVRKLAPRVGTNREGIPVAMQGEVTRGADGKTRITLSFGVATGDKIQVVTLIATDDDAFAALAKPVGTLVGRATVRLPPAKGLPVALPEGSKTRTAFNLTHAVPTGFAWHGGTGVNLAQYSVTAPLAGRKAGHPMRVVVDVQGRIPSEPRALLRNWLLVTDFGVPRVKGTQVKPLVLEEARLPSGLQYVAVVLRDVLADRWTALRVGYLVYGPRWFALVGSAYGENEDLAKLEGPHVKAAKDYFTGTVAKQLFAIAGSVKWSTAKLEGRKAIKDKLIARKRYHYFSQKNLSSGDFHYFHESSVTWKFGADGTCEVHAKKFSGWNDYSPYNPSGGGSRSQPGKNRKARFDVAELGGKLFLLVWQPTGWSSVHSLELDKAGTYGVSEFRGLAIDGLIEGRYYKGDGYQQRKEN